MRMFAGMAASISAVATLASPTAAQDQPKPTVESTGMTTRTIQLRPEPPVNDVDIHRVSAMSFEPDQRALIPLGRLPVRIKQDVDLYVDQQGKPLRCNPMAEELSPAQRELICAALMQSATVTPFSSYDLAGQHGRIAISFAAQPAPTHTIALDDLDAGSAETAGFIVSGLDRESGVVYSCYARPADSRMVISPPERAVLCDKFEDDDEWRNMACREVDSEDMRSVKMRCDIPVNRADTTLQYFYTASPRSDALKRTPKYASRKLSELPDFTRDQATIRPSAAARIQYPSRAIRMDLDGRTDVIIGINRNGRVASCRPVKTSGHVYLDNDTCLQLARYGRFDVAEGEGDYEGLKYQAISIKWVVPD